ncbi:hypothetical protein GCM10010277_53880 [Streptomyces longisporoflavus]|uniref:DUF397 domain-containing protein n=1 Tax=Streptomyces longisporoflavus TaxID=28044 RepID=UPI00167D287A|nr:DUF397 domain-containing protein [Streptomyces longisporoflavus]GGV54772.1 hypothetical protein GCM10010277_53880 [Streptomyces longisporoflavus]
MNPPLTWQKSSFSDGAGANCVYVAAARNAGTIHLRESDAPEASLATTPAAFAALIRSLARK